MHNVRAAYHAVFIGLLAIGGISAIIVGAVKALQP